MTTRSPCFDGCKISALCLLLCLKFLHCSSHKRWSYSSSLCFHCYGLVLLNQQARWKAPSPTPNTFCLRASLPEKTNPIRSQLTLRNYFTDHKYNSIWLLHVKMRYQKQIQYFTCFAFNISSRSGLECLRFINKASELSVVSLYIQ